MQQQRQLEINEEKKKKKPSWPNLKILIAVRLSKRFCSQYVGRTKNSRAATSFVSFFQFLCHWDHSFVGSSSDLARVYVDILRDHFAFLG